MRRALTWLVALLFLYSGVAWALENCLRNLDHIDHKSGEFSHGADSGLASDVDPEGHSETKLHCLAADEQIGPAGRSASTPRLGPSSRATLLKVLFSSATLAAVSERKIWLRAFPEKFAPFSFLAASPLHVILSVFLI